MFGKISKESIKNSTVIGASIVIEGCLSGEQDIIIYGKLTGSIKTSGNVFVKKTACIDADIKANNVFIEGIVNGNLNSLGIVELLSNGVINGDVITKVINISKGAVFNGKCNIIKDEDSNIIKNISVVNDNESVLSDIILKKKKSSKNIIEKKENNKI